jgi:16S rRNA processing protein RimM
VAWDDFVLVGFVARPHGHRGQVIVNPESDFVAERFAPGATIWIRTHGAPRPMVIRECRIHQGRPVVALDGVDSMNAASELRGAEIRVPAEAQAVLPEGQFYHHELIGCLVVTTAGAEVGPVRAVEGTPGAERLVVTGSNGDVLIPLAWPICVAIDPAAHRITVDPPEGLLELNA